MSRNLMFVSQTKRTAFSAMVLDLVPPDSHIFFQLTRGRIKCVSYSDVNVFAGFVLAGLLVDHYFPVGYCQIDSHAIEIARLAMRMRLFHKHSALHDAIAKQIEFFCPLANELLDCFRLLNIAKTNLYW